ncbi:MAG: amino acid ABC transporter permease [Bdellovibrio sp. CG10_big_fil_rev_8_21_14_0_10_47_8]|nr:MAG: amino acid ABC transporter permease [Bdellovibrio sp. CG10_big_fil_rev_8_21_14_0_10_47_8]
MGSLFWNLFGGFGHPCFAGETVTVGSKNFTESYILGEIVAQLLEDDPSLTVQRKFGLGGTGIIYEALRKEEIDIYVEYTGTITENILKEPGLKDRALLQKKLEDLGMTISAPLGFNNTYALAVRKDFSEQHHLKTISDLNKLGDQARVAFSFEFMSRSDGYPSLKKHYGLTFGKNVKSMDHSLVYEAIQNNQVDVIEVYSTDGKLETFDLEILKDDKNFFPTYDAVLMTSLNFVKNHPLAWEKLRTLENQFDEKLMQHLNAEADLNGKSFPAIASTYLERGAPDEVEAIFKRVWRRTKEHLLLVGVSLVFSIFVGIPMGILATRSKLWGQVILIFSGLLQTIPSLALLVFLIPLFGIGTLPALVALFLYGLLPVVVNTHEGMVRIDPRLLESARSLGLSDWQRIRLIELPLASPNILAGVRTSAIIGIGTATLAALIGAGGYGAPIVTGLALNDLSTIYIGAIPAALMAVVAHFLFGFISQIVIPKGLRL